jgi:hypothetical protein
MTWSLENPRDKKGNYGVAMQQAKPYFRKFLRELVDQWIDSGHRFRSDVADVPKERSLFNHPSHVSTLGNLIQNWLKRNPPSIGALSGYVGFPGGLSDQPPIFLQFNPPKLNEDLRPEVGGVLWAKELATYCLFRLIASPAQNRLAFCSKCNRYFVYQRARAQRNETVCPSCNTSAQRTKASRDRRKSEMLDMAARAWSLRNQSLSSAEQRAWVAKQVSKKCGTNIERKWVSQNLTEIQKRVEALRNAKG